MCPSLFFKIEKGLKEIGKKIEGYLLELKGG